MRRFIFLLLLIATFFQLAVAGMPMAAVETVAAAETPASMEHAQGTAGIFACADKVVIPGQTGCESTQSCTLCGVCQACHQAALLDGDMASIVSASMRRSIFPRPMANFASADPIPSFKPPIR